MPYISLIYDNGSHSGGLEPCKPFLDPDVLLLSRDQMRVGAWLPIDSSTRMLAVVKENLSYVALGDFATMSVREDAVMRNLLACGRVRAGQ